MWTIATRQLVIEGGLSGEPAECRYCRYPAPKGCCHGNRFLALCMFGAHWHHLANPCVAAMRPYVKLLWPLVIIIIIERGCRSDAPVAGTLPLFSSIYDSESFHLASAAADVQSSCSNWVSHLSILWWICMLLCCSVVMIDVCRVNRLARLKRQKRSLQWQSCFSPEM